MTFTIAIAGKGGTGKTTLAGLLIDQLRQAGVSPILAIDADPASNLNTVLDLPLERTVGDIREDTSEKARSGRLEAGVAKQDLLDYEINASIVEGEGVDLLAMGRPEGPGCYCAANNMLRVIVDRISSSYDYVVIDNEAGLEHLSRRTTRDVDVLLIISDASIRGLTTARRIVDLIDELKTDVGRHYLIVNRATGPLTPELELAVKAYGLNLLAIVHADQEIADLDATGRPLIDLQPANQVCESMNSVLSEILPEVRKEKLRADHR
jgi:CO dehydrogenase maturation factor